MWCLLRDPELYFIYFFVEKKAILKQHFCKSINKRHVCPSLYSLLTPLTFAPFPSSLPCPSSSTYLMLLPDSSQPSWLCYWKSSNWLERWIMAEPLAEAGMDRPFHVCRGEETRRRGEDWVTVVEWAVILIIFSNFSLHCSGESDRKSKNYFTDFFHNRSFVCYMTSRGR